MGVSGLSIDQVAEFIGGFVERGLDVTNPLPNLAVAEAFKRANDDLQAFYQEAATAQPGHGGSHADVLDWFWGQTQAGKVLLACREKVLASGDKRLAFLGNVLVVPRLAQVRLGI